MKRISSAEVVRALKRVDWNFPRSATPPTSVHTLHWFPGNFIPQIPRFLIEILSGPGDVVLDPFCGSGTTGVEAVRLARESRQSDVNPASIQVAQGKMAVISGRGSAKTIRSISEKLVWDFASSISFKGTRHETNQDLRRWIHGDTLEQLQFIWSLIVASSGAARSMLEMIFTDTLFRCASTARALTRTGGQRRHHWGWVADNVAPVNLVPHDAFALFRLRLKRLQDLLDIVGDDAMAASEITQEDARCLALADESVDVVVTSPPYLGMIDYTLANRLAFLWMNWSMAESLGCEIGARRHRRRATGLDEYLAAMRLTCAEMHRVLKSGSFCALVVGASRRFPETIGQLHNIFRERFELVWGPVSRIPTRRRIAERKGSAPMEYIIVFRK